MSAPRPSTAVRLISNGAWNVLSTAISGGVAFLLVPLLFNRLGAPAYGTWILVGSLFAYSSVLHFGFTSAISRHVAIARATGTDDDLRRILSTGTVFFTGVGTLIAAATFLVRHYFTRVFAVPPELVGEARSAVLIVGGLLAVTVVMESYGAAISGLQRFDLFAMCRAGMVALRATVLVIVLARGGDLIAVAWIYAFTELGVNALYLIFATRLLPPGVILPRAFDASLLPGMLTYGTNTFLYTSGAVIAYKASEVIIGIFRSAEEVAHYAVAGVGVLTLAAVVDSLGAAIRPAVSDLHARDAGATIRELSLSTAKYGMLVIIPSTAFLVLMGGDFVRLWTGLTDPSVSQVLAILAVGQAVRLSQQSDFLVLAGKGEHRFFGFSVLLVGILTVAGTVLAVGVLSTGILGAAVASSVSWILVAGIVIPRHVSTRLGTSFAERWHRVLAPALTASLPGLLLLVAWGRLGGAGSWAELLLLIVSVAICTAGSAWFFGMQASERTRVRSWVVRARRR